MVIQGQDVAVWFVIVMVTWFAKFIGACIAFVVELWGVFEGLIIAHIRGFQAVELCVDSEVVVNSLKSDAPRRVVGWSLINKIQKLLGLDWEVKVCHSYRESKRCADVFATVLWHWK